MRRMKAPAQKRANIQAPAYLPYLYANSHVGKPGRRYYITTWDPETHRFTPQPGVRDGPLTFRGLLRAVRILRMMGYSGTRDDPSIYVCAVDCLGEATSA